MANLTKDQVRDIVAKRPLGATPEGVVAALRAQGHQLEGYGAPPATAQRPRRPRQPIGDQLIETGLSSLSPTLGVAGGILGIPFGPAGPPLGAVAGGMSGRFLENVGRQALGRPDRTPQLLGMWDMPQGGGLMAEGINQGVMSGAAGLPTAAGLGARSLTNWLGRRSANRAETMIRTGRAASQGVQPAVSPVDQALARQRTVARAKDVTAETEAALTAAKGARSASAEAVQSEVAAAGGEPLTARTIAERVADMLEADRGKALDPIFRRRLVKRTQRRVADLASQSAVGQAATKSVEVPSAIIGPGGRPITTSRSAVNKNEVTLSDDDIDRMRKIVQSTSPAKGAYGAAEAGRRPTSDPVLDPQIAAVLRQHEIEMAPGVEQGLARTQQAILDVQGLSRLKRSQGRPVVRGIKQRGAERATAVSATLRQQQAEEAFRLATERQVAAARARAMLPGSSGFGISPYGIHASASASGVTNALANFLERPAVAPTSQIIARLPAWLQAYYMAQYAPDTSGVKK